MWCRPCRRGPRGQALLLRDVHVALLRVLDSADDELLAAPPAASEVAPPELGPHDAFRSAKQGLGFSRCSLTVPSHLACLGDSLCKRLAIPLLILHMMLQRVWHRSSALQTVMLASKWQCCWALVKLSRVVRRRHQAAQQHWSLHRIVRCPGRCWA
jgi:hypothetical protein